MSASTFSPAALSLVGAGGACGSILRYLVAVWGTGVSGKFPVGTLVVNVVGCLCAGALLAFMSLRDQPSMHMRLLLGAGFLGGFTTFSAFGLETVQLVQRGHAGLAALNAVANVVLGLGAAGAGFAVAKAFA